MTVKYTPGENGLVGRSFKVEIVAIEMTEIHHVDSPLLTSVKIKFEDGKSKWISGQELFDNTDMKQKALVKKIK